MATTIETNRKVMDKAAKDRAVETIVGIILRHHEYYDHDPDPDATFNELTDDLWLLDLKTVKAIETALQAMVGTIGRLLNGTTA